jgi:hypothetical protein
LKRENFRDNAAYGKAVHEYIEQKINGPGSIPKDLNFRAETTLFESGIVKPNTKDSARSDVFENPGKGTVCIHDVKTGEKGLSFEQMTKLVATAHSFYPNTSRVIFTEVRPSK